MPNSKTPKIKRALISVYDKTGIVDFGRRLEALGVELISSGGTAKELRANGISVVEVSELTGVAEAMDGRLKTLHPKIFGAILANLDKKSHIKDLGELGETPIGMVVCNLYPFSSDPNVELIDIGGPSMIRAAAKNFAFVASVVDPTDYDAVAKELENGNLTLSDGTRQNLAKKAFGVTAKYDRQIEEWYSNLVLENSEQNKKDSEKGSKEKSERGIGDNESKVLPNNINLTLNKIQDLRYGENPHMAGALYEIVGNLYESTDSSSNASPNTTPDFSTSFWGTANQLHGKELSYLNILDTTAAWELANDLQSTKYVLDGGTEEMQAAVIVKHSNPCGAAIADNINEAFSLAHSCDEVSAFGGIVALPATVDAELAEKLHHLFLEVVIARGFNDDALSTLSKKKNIRLITAEPPATIPLQIRSVENRILAQAALTNEDSGNEKVGNADYKVVTEKQPSKQEWADLLFAEKVVAATVSNAIVIAKDGVAFGIGAGQQNRKDATAIACGKAAGRAIGGVCASDAFFPFPDGLDGAIQAGCTAVIQPGGSQNDAEVISAAEAAGLSMVFSGVRHFRH